ncbi:GNAT family N-acetyltransferase [Candidatus Pacearchaeota archaeon]|nr:GNAT family N-acetyltransferase [Candidatus Pacearchaeota archaeon]
MVRLVTKRLALTEVLPEYELSIAKYANNLEVSKWMFPLPYPYRLSDARWFINDCAKKRKKRPKKSYFLAITFKDTGQYLGGIGVHSIDKDKGECELGYWLGQPFWRKGIVSEACNKLISYAFNRLKLRKIIVPVFESNVRSAGLAQKLGGKFTGYEKEDHVSRATGIAHKTRIYVITKSSWEKSLR